ncbi:GNAT family N-acetyltransferase [Rhodopila sp.]|uniref:GNAT family N-acetyltransferase n=1 Tax=Rhodopila sp. TaxID=2480087 RepID=UPI003D118203
MPDKIALQRIAAHTEDSPPADPPRADSRATDSPTTHPRAAEPPAADPHPADPHPAHAKPADNDPLPIGPPVDTTPRPLPARNPIRGQHATLEPLHRRHVSELWHAAQGADASWTYLGAGPFASAEAMGRHVMDAAASHDPMLWAVRPVITGVVSGWLALMDIQPRNASIELGGIWFAPRMQRTRAATEAIFLLLKLAADDLGYRRLVWKCDALNAASRRAATRLGFTHEGRHRMHMISKGRQRDTDWFSIVGEEWPPRRDALLAWLDPSNFAADGTALHGLAELRAAPTSNRQA